MKKWILIILLSLVPVVYAQNYYDIYANNGAYLGNTNANQLDPNSINNPLGKYGNQLSPDSMRNPMGQYGSQLSPVSPNNQISQPGVAVPIYSYGQPVQFGGWSRRY